MTARDSGKSLAGIKRQGFRLIIVTSIVAASLSALARPAAAQPAGIMINEPNPMPVNLTFFVDSEPPITVNIPANTPALGAAQLIQKAYGHGAVLTDDHVTFPGQVGVAAYGNFTSITSTLDTEDVKPARKGAAQLLS